MDIHKSVEMADFLTFEWRGHTGGGWVRDGGEEGTDYDYFTSGTAAKTG